MIIVESARTVFMLTVSDMHSLLRREILKKKWRIHIIIKTQIVIITYGCEVSWFTLTHTLINTNSVHTDRLFLCSYLLWPSIALRDVTTFRGIFLWSWVAGPVPSENRVCSYGNRTISRTEISSLHGPTVDRDSVVDIRTRHGLHGTEIEFWIACWSSGFESRRWHGCFLSCVVSKDKKVKCRIVKVKK